MQRGEIDTNKFDVFMAAEFARSANFFDSTLRYLPHQSDGISESVGICRNLLESVGEKRIFADRIWIRQNKSGGSHHGKRV